MSSNEPYTVEVTVPVSPDGGYGWLVVCAAFLAHVITHGILYSFGVLFITIEERFGGSKADVSWILSIATGMLYLIGPVAGYLSGRYGIKMVTILGSVLGSIGFILSMFVTNLFVLYITLGFITGCGFGMVFLGAIVIVTLYFDRRRSLASGIALSGAGSGAFIFSPLMKALTNMFSWKGTFLILAGLILNCIPFGLIFKPVTAYKLKQTSLRIKTDDKENTHVEDELKPLYDHDAGIPKDYTPDTVNSVEMERVLRSGNSDKLDCEKSSDFVIANCRELPIKTSDALSDKSRTSNYMKNKGTPSKTMPFATSNCCHEEYQLKHNDSELDKYTQSIEHNDTKPRVQEYETTSLLNETDYLQQTPSSNSAERNEYLIPGVTETKLTVRHEQESSPSSSIKNQVGLFRSKVFVVFLLSQFLFFLGFYLPFFYIPDKARQTGIPEGIAVWVVSVIGISSILGRIVLGYIADKPNVNRLLIFEVALLVSGLSTAMGPLMLTPWSLLIYAPVYGIFTGIILSLTPVVLADLLGVNQLANAFGINNFFCGVASFIGPPFAGFLYDVTGNYNFSFIAAGISMTTAGLLMFVARCFKAKPITTHSNQKG